MLMHSFVLDALDTTAADTFSHFEMLIDEHRLHYENQNDSTGTGTGTHIGPSRLKQLVPTVGTFHTHLPLRKAFMAYNKKYSLTKRKFITITFNELRHILNLAQIMALRGHAGGLETFNNGSIRNDNTNTNGAETPIEEKYGHGRSNSFEEDQNFLRKSLKQWTNSPGLLSCNHKTGFQSGNGGVSGGLVPPVLPPEISLGVSASATPTSDSLSKSPPKVQVLQTKVQDPVSFKGPTMITFDGDQTLYSDGANFEGNPQLANYLYLLLRHGVTLAVVTAAGFEYNTERYEMRLSGLLAYFKSMNLPPEDCERFYLFGGECNFLLKVSGSGSGSFRTGGCRRCTRPAR